MFSKKLVYPLFAAALFAIVGCSDTSHANSAPDDEASAENSSSSFGLHDLDLILGNSSSSIIIIDPSKGDNPESSASEDEGEDADKKDGDKKDTDKKDSTDNVTSSNSEAGDSGNADEDSDEPASSSSKTKTSSSSEDEPTHEIVPLTNGKCVDDTTSAIKQALKKVNERSVSMFQALSKKDIDQVKVSSDTTKMMYGKILARSPKSCEAQVGYAISSVMDFLNNDLLNEIVNAYKKGGNAPFNSLTDESMINNLVQTANEISNDKSTITLKMQKELADEMIPGIDSSIIYMQNVISVGDYKMNVPVDGKDREVDNSEFQPALGLLFAAKAVFTMVCSVNLEVAHNNSYDWISALNSINIRKEQKISATQAEAVKIAIDLIKADKLFTSVYESWTDEWAKIPVYLDSAFHESRAGFKYSISESAEPGEQDNDIYIVGDDADADVSLDDIQNMVTALDIAIDAIELPYKINYKGIDAQINVKKFFANTDGITKFNPYYVYTDESDLTTFYFTDKSGKKTISLVDVANMKDLDVNALVNKVVFPDPTFGGIFPKFSTQEDIWNFISSVNDL